MDVCLQSSKMLQILPRSRDQHYGKIPLIDCTLIEDPSSDVYYFDDDTISWESFGSLTSATTLLTAQACDRDRNNYNGLDFKIIIDSKSGPPTTLTLVASTHQEKIAWCSDISQCIENLHYSDLLNSSMSESSSVTMPQSVRSDPKLFKDDVDIRFSRTLNSCKVPQIRHASVDRLLDRLTDLRFLSIDFLNTFLLTYRVFSSGKVVLEALKRVYKNPEQTLDSSLSSCHCLISAEQQNNNEVYQKLQQDLESMKLENEARFVKTDTKISNMEGRISKQDEIIHKQQELIKRLQRNQELQKHTRQVSVQKKVAFTYRTSGDQSSLGSDQTIKFDRRITDVSNSYSSSTGIFTAPVGGYYAFVLDTRTLPGRICWIDAVKNGFPIATNYMEAPSGQEDSETSFAVVRLDTGDQVWVRNKVYHGHSCGLDDLANFSGFLLYQDL
ncbi:Ras-specific guanine nucleotide-releasing factor 1 [Mytilus galloprovincialis]|uniref:Ras-specific guanine nucleotide-releasing factor 1 n=1 Tax=Mytilus galloprovincialis TaxID=29158 RepID=A0A8B6FMC0_MYTGA|nr:Ras-specific guanine nucleotide-releasing factor 1 [Mytilus galloprovincialis]